MYSQGLGGLPNDPAQAAELWRQAASAGDPYGEYYLGTAYLSGAGVQKDPVQGRAWLRKAAGHGVPEARSWVQRETLWNKAIDYELHH